MIVAKLSVWLGITNGIFW